MTVDERVNAPAVAASGLVLGLVLFLVAAAYSSITIIQPGNVGVVFNRWSGAPPPVRRGRGVVRVGRGPLAVLFRRHL